MLPPEKVTPALHAIHTILIKLQYMVLEGVDGQKLYQILDYTEILPTLITRQEKDTTEEFREMLLGLGEAFPEFAGIVTNFDRDITWDRVAQGAAG